MEPADAAERVEVAYRTLTTIWAALMAGVVLFAGVSYLLLRMGVVEPVVEPVSAVAHVIVGLGFLELIAAPFVGGYLLRRSGEKDEGSRLTAYHNSTMVALALRECAGLLGGLTVLLTGEMLAGYALAAAAVVMMIRGRPRREHLERLSRSVA